MSSLRRRLLLLPFLPYLLLARRDDSGSGSPCYITDVNGNDDLNVPQKCMPAFENVVSNKLAIITPKSITCGLRSRTEYCVQTQGIERECDFCEDRDPERRHPAQYLTDIDTDFNGTHWQSVTMAEDVHTVDVNITFNLGKAYDITYVRLRFQSPRPASFAIYKKNRKNPQKEDSNPDLDWIPWQYYSVTCRDTYKMPDSLSIIQPRNSNTKINEDRALCTSEYSDMTPLNGGNVAFSTLEGRPSAFNFEYSPELQNWVSATDIRISFQRLNTFGDEIFGDPKVLRSYYYAVTDLTVGGRCQCNGHATHCIPSDIDDPESSTVCLCQHGTDGPNCDTCLADHWDRPWRHSTAQNANECKPCECNNWSSRCRFNEQLYMDTGHGGECMDCGGFRDGPNCERCKPHHFFSAIQDKSVEQVPCEPCNCDPTGSLSLQCFENGVCECKIGVTGTKCDQCKANYWSFDSLGCKDCGCLPEGSIGNQATCDTRNSDCFCKQNVEGQRCDRCKAGHFHIDKDNEFGCTPCFCYGHTSKCDSSGGYTKALITSDFSRNSGDWTSEENGKSLSLKYDGTNKFIGVQSLPDPNSKNSKAYFVAPSRYLGDQRASYNQALSFKLRVNDQNPRSGRYDVIIHGGGAKETFISLSLTEQNNPLPSYVMQDYTFRLHENPEFGWNPVLSSKDFMSILANISAIKIRGTYVPGGMGFLDEVRLGTAERGGTGLPATWIERCMCPEGYQGQFCELCKGGYHHENNGGPFARCLLCNCNDHASSCDSESGKCECVHNTDGHNCEKCARGYYGNALTKQSTDCQPCPCPEGGACLEMPGNSESPICIECPNGRTGPRCELCKDGYFGDPMGRFGAIRPCQECECNKNVDVNAIGNCDRTSGECLRCVDNTDGFNCERCKSGFFGDALILKKPGDPPSCQHCQCYPVGTFIDEQTFLPICNGFTGDCSCKAHVVGRDCEKCSEGYFNIESGEGCEPCNCDTTGSLNNTCNLQTGQCHCSPGVSGQRCDMCLPYYYGFSIEGCRPCDCDPSGSHDLQCDLVTGQCLCRNKVEGRQCDRCEENTRSLKSTGDKTCESCDDCYNLVQEAANEHRRNLKDLESLLKQIEENPEPVGEDFEVQLRDLRVRVTQSLADARISSLKDEGGSLRERLMELKASVYDVKASLETAAREIERAQMLGEQGKDKVKTGRVVIERVKETLKNATRLLETNGRDALLRATERSRTFGRESEKMSGIAREAGAIAEKLVEDANEILSIAKMASETSASAYELTRSALEDQYHEANTIQVLESQVSDLSKKLQTVENLGLTTHRESSEAYKDALLIYQQALSLTVPEMDAVNYERVYNENEKEIRRLNEEAERLLSQNEDVLREAQRRRSSLDSHYNRSLSTQKELQLSFENIVEARTLAFRAVKTGNDVLKDAQKTLETLKAFESRVGDNKYSAETALKNVESISSLINVAQDKTRRASEALGGADVSADLALNVARDAKRIAEEASGIAENISKDASVTRNSAEQLSESVSSLELKMKGNLQEISNKEAVAEQESLLAIEALSKANTAQIKAREATKKVAQAKKELESISAILYNVQEPEPGLLEDLERRINEAEKKFKNADLELRVKRLEEAKARQETSVFTLEKERSIVREEVASILQILESLPNFCPNSNERCLEDKC